MAKFKIEFDCDNAAFFDDYDTMENVWHIETARILHDLADEIDCNAFDGGSIFDINGNKIGTFEYTE